MSTLNNSSATIRKVKSTEIPQCFSVISTAFGHHTPFIEVYYPNHGTPAGDAKASSRLQKWFDSDTSTFLTAELPGGPNGGIVAIGIWTLAREEQPWQIEKIENVEEVWAPVGGEKEIRFMSQIWKAIVAPRNSVIRTAGEKGVWVLEMLAVHPEAQKRGIGEKLIRWATDQADKENRQAVLESTRTGRKVYEKCGFVGEIDPMPFPVDEEYKDRAKPDLAFMRRQPRANGSG